MVTEVSENEILQWSIEENIPIIFDKRKTVFTVREIEDHKKESGKIMRQLKRQVTEAF